MRKAEERAHILIGIAVAVENIDEIIKIIKSSKDTASAKKNLLENVVGIDDENVFSVDNGQDSKMIEDVRDAKCGELRTQQVHQKTDLYVIAAWIQLIIGCVMCPLCIIAIFL